MLISVFCQWWQNRIPNPTLRRDMSIVDPGPCSSTLRRQSHRLSLPKQQAFSLSHHEARSIPGWSCLSSDLPLTELFYPCATLAAWKPPFRLYLRVPHHPRIQLSHALWKICGAIAASTQQTFAHPHIVACPSPRRLMPLCFGLEVESLSRKYSGVCQLKLAPWWIHSAGRAGLVHADLGACLVSQTCAVFRGVSWAVD